MMMRLLTIAICLLFAHAAQAGTFTIQHTFSGGTTAVASEVNTNFTDAKAAIDGNDADVAALEATSHSFTLSDTITVSPGAITSTNCVSVTPATATGALSTDVVTWSFNSDVSAVTGYEPLTTGAVSLYVWPSTDAVNVRVCNPTTASITPTSIVLNWSIVR